MPVESLRRGTFYQNPYIQPISPLLPMKYILPLLAASSVACSGAYEPTNQETEVLSQLPGEELVNQDWQIYEECGEDLDRITCYRVFEGPNDEFFSFNIDKWNNQNSFAKNVDPTVKSYEMENQLCPKGLNQRFVKDHTDNSLIMILSDDIKYTADHLASNYVNR